MTDKIRNLLNDVRIVYEGKGMLVYPNSFDELRTEIMKLDNINRLQSEQIIKAKKIITNLVKFDGSYKNDEEFQRQSELYDKIWEEAEQFLEEDEWKM